MGSKAFAQEPGEIEKVEIEIIKNREVSVPQANRNFEKVPPRPAEPIKPQITYQFSTISFNAPDFNPAIRPLKLKTEPISKIYGNYVSAGLANYGFPSPYAEAYITNKRNKNYYYGAKFYHRSFAKGPVDNGNSASGNTEFRLFGKAIGNGVAIGGFVDYDNTVSHFYGYKPGSNPSSSSIRQSYDVISFGAEIENTKASDFKYTLKSGYSNLTDHYSATESEFYLGLPLEYKTGKDSRVIFNFDYQFMARKDSKVSLNPRHIVRVKPAYQFSPLDELTLKIGANVAYENDTIGKQKGLHVYPNLRGDYNFSSSVSVYAGLTGDVDKVSLHSLSRENNWVNSNINIYNTNRALEFFGGLQGKIEGGFSFGLGASIASLKNLYFYQADTGNLNQAKFNVVYDNGSTQRTNLFGELGFVKSKFKLNLRADSWLYSSAIANQVVTEKGIVANFASGALMRPSYRFTVSSSYNIVEKFLFEVDFITQGGIKALDIEKTAAKLVTLSPAADLNLRANYFVSKQATVFINCNNVLSSNYQLYYNYPVRGFQVLLGASWNF
ncbi:MAG TPA: hypothetical protein DGG95_08855 [Cytophagales bacterium]|nr:hypothetical protein [Cytophagales bacterium]